MTTAISNRAARSSSYTFTLSVCDSPEEIVGQYKCEVRNRWRGGIYTRSYTVQGEEFNT